MDLKEMEELINDGQCARLLTDKVKAFEDLLKAQKEQCGDKNSMDYSYNAGIYNGLAIGLAIMTGEEPQFLE